MPQTQKNMMFTLLTLALGVFFLIQGVQDIMNWNSSGAEFIRKVGQILGSTQNNVLPLLFGILSLVSGVVLILSPWGLLSDGLRNLTLLLVFFYWIVKIAFDFFLFGSLNPDDLGWYKSLSWNLVILSSLWILRAEV